MSKPSRRNRNQTTQKPRTNPSSVSLSLTQSRTDVYPAIFPAAEEMERYESMAPGCVERVVTQFERQSEHRRRLEFMDMEADVRLSYHGLYAALVVVLTFIGTGTLLILRGHSVTGIGSALTGLALIVGCFVYASKNRRAEREQKQRILSGDR